MPGAWLAIVVSASMLMIVPERPERETYTSQEFMFVDSQQFDHLASSLGAAQTRRNALRLFGVAALGAAGAGFAVHTDISARRKRKKKKQKQETNDNNAVCTPGKVFATVTVPANGQTVSSPKLPLNQRYRARVTGFWSTNAQYGNDAFAAFPFANPGAPELTYQGVRLGLSVNGGTPDLWGAYNAGHSYEQTLIGFGVPATFRFTDPVTTDNSGSVTVIIECA